MHSLREGINLVILDMIMPKKSGKEVSDTNREKSPGMKILFASGYTMEVSTSRCYLHPVIRNVTDGKSRRFLKSITEDKKALKVVLRQPRPCSGKKLKVDRKVSERSNPDFYITSNLNQ